MAQEKTIASQAASARSYKLSENNVGADGRKITLPYYMAMFLE